MFDLQASYTIVHEDDVAIFIIDDDHGRSISNDAERVVQNLLTGRRNKRIFYRDTDHRWDELTHSGFQFTSFRMVNSDDELYELFKKITKRF